MLLALYAISVEIGYCQMDVAANIDTRYMQAEYISINQSIEVYDDVKDSEPRTVTSARIMKSGGKLRIDGPESTILIDDDVYIQVSKSMKTIFVDTISSKTKAEIAEPNLKIQALEADTCVFERMANGNLRMSLAYLSDPELLVEYELDPLELVMLSVTETAIMPKHIQSRGYVYPRVVTKAESCSFNSNDIDTDAFDFTDFVHYNQRSELVPSTQFPGYTIVNPNRTKLKI